MNRFIQVTTTINDEKKAGEIAESLLKNRIAACVQIFGPITSSYWWNGSIEKTSEWICLAKGKSSDFEKIHAMIKSMHTYETPEILATPICNGSSAYLRWIQKETDANTT